jgi:hypothetical protein
MQERRFWIGLIAVLSASCGTPDDPYSRIADPPVVQARLQTVTLASDVPGVVEQILNSGYTPVALPPNYPQATAVEAAVWGVPETAAANARYFKAAAGGGPDLRLLPTAAAGGAAREGAERAFFEKVLGSPVPAWPLKQPPGAGVQVRVWTFLVPDVLAANRRLRENNIPVIYDPVAITTAYLGDHRMLAIRAPDGTVVQLVESAAQ